MNKSKDAIVYEMIRFICDFFLKCELNEIREVMSESENEYYRDYIDGMKCVYAILSTEDFDICDIANNDKFKDILEQFENKILDDEEIRIS